MGRTISIGVNDFEKIRTEGHFYIDKTDFIKEWWESCDAITMIIRPLRFGKKLNMSMLECFFSNRYAGRSELFEGLNIWKEEKYRELQGKYPVLFLNFADVKGKNYKELRNGILSVFMDLYKKHDLRYMTRRTRRI